VKNSRHTFDLFRFCVLETEKEKKIERRRRRKKERETERKSFLEGE
jgi:hypothetical protein